MDVATNKEQDGSEGMQTENKVDAATNKEQDGSESMQSASDSKKDPFQRRHELLIKSELAEVTFIQCYVYSNTVLKGCTFSH